MFLFSITIICLKATIFLKEILNDQSALDRLQKTVESKELHWSEKD